MRRHCSRPPQSPWPWRDADRDFFIWCVALSAFATVERLNNSENLAMNSKCCLIVLFAFFAVALEADLELVAADFALEQERHSANIFQRVAVE